LKTNVFVKQKINGINKTSNKMKKEKRKKKEKEDEKPKKRQHMRRVNQHREIFYKKRK
jgi:hypothetical protein